MLGKIVKNQRNFYGRRAIKTVGVLLGGALAMYFIAIWVIVSNGVAARATEAKSEEIRANIAALEGKYLNELKGIDKSSAALHNLEEPLSTNFVKLAPPSIGAAASSNGS